MIHLHRWRPLLVRQSTLMMVLFRTGTEHGSEPRTRVVEKCTRCRRVRDGADVEGHWTLDKLFTKAEQYSRGKDGDG